jgi:hypothetical protein
LDVLSTVAYGSPFGFLSTDTDVYQFIETSEKVIPTVMMVTVFPWLNYILASSFMKSLLPSERDPIGFGKIIGFVLLLILQGWLNESRHYGATMSVRLLMHSDNLKDIVGLQ